MVGEFGETVVIDWGEAGGGPGDSPRNLTLLTGSPRYASPEQVEGREVGPAADVHSLGSMLYEILTGTSPYLRSDTRATLEALRRGEVQPPERAAPERGADPVLSELSMSALSHDPAARPSAREFASRLGRYVRSEREWEVVRFGPDDRPVAESEWKTLLGKWELRDGVWAAADDGHESILVWNTPVPGDFRFSAEGWAEKKGELSLIGHGPSPVSLTLEEISARGRSAAYAGYCFQFGAEDNNCTKLARDGQDTLVDPALEIEPGRKYRLEIEYQAGWLRCFVDEQQVFAYRELFPRAGTGVGFYSYGLGAHLRPLEIRRQNWALQPAMRMADELYVHGFLDAAIERYVQIADRNPHRLEGDEARLKIGICLARRDSVAGARKMFRSVDTGPMKAYAMAEEGMLDFRSRPDDDVARGTAVLRRLAEEFPQSHAKVRICEAANRSWTRLERPLAPTLVEDLRLRQEICALAAATYDPPMQSQMKAWTRSCTYLLRLGRYAEALETGRELSDKTYARKQTYYYIAYPFTAVALAAGREDLLPISHWEVSTFRLRGSDWTTSLPMHIIVRGLLPASAGVMDPVDLCRKLASELRPFDAFPVLLAGGDVEGADEVLPQAAASFDSSLVPSQAVIAAVESGLASCFNQALEIVENRRSRAKDDHARGALAATLAVARARWALEIEDDLVATAAALEGHPPPTIGFPLSDGLLLQVLLASLEVPGVPDRDELAAGVEQYLAGTPQDLARMFLGQKAPVPGELWPHPLWRPEWRLWLALWLERKGQRAEALEIVRPARDERYGLANSQPAIQRLLERLQR
jgi:hypothetical protein